MVARRVNRFLAPAHTLRSVEGMIVPFDVIIGHNWRTESSRESVKTSLEDSNETPLEDSNEYFEECCV